MTRQNLIEETISKIQKLPDVKIMQVNDFVEFLLSKINDKVIVEGIQKLISDSKTFEFLNDEEDIYTIKDIKEKYGKKQSK